jgi:archaemetzincin
MLNGILPAMLALVTSVTGSLSVDRPVVAIQPFGRLDADVVARVESGIRERFDVEVVVLPERGLPAAAYYEPRDRYRAERLLEALERAAAGRYAKVVGLTARDISTSTETHADWGVFGLGDLGGETCVVSTYRLARGAGSETVLEERLLKAVSHELGHTFGIGHGPTEGCVMADAAGTIRTVDAGAGRFCDQCLARLAQVKR